MIIEHPAHGIQDTWSVKYLRSSTAIRIALRCVEFNSDYDQTDTFAESRLQAEEAAAEVGNPVAMEFQDVVRRRRMVRNFEKRAVAPEVVDRLLDNARRAPSAGFSQGWAFLVLDRADDVARFWGATLPAEERDAFPWPGLLDAPLIIVPLSNKRAYLDRYAEPDKGWTDRDEGRWPTPYWDVDAGFAAMSVMLTAVDAGLGSLFFGIFKVEAFREAFGVPADFHPIGALAVGHPLPDRPSGSLQRGRKPLGEVVHRGRWQGLRD